MDNGPQFASSEFQQFLREYGVRALMASVYNPRENGLVERWNKTLKFGVQAFCSLGKKWEEGITELLSQHRHMPASAQGPSPAQILFGRKTRMAFEHAGPQSQSDGLEEKRLGGADKNSVLCNDLFSTLQDEHSCSAPVTSEVKGSTSCKLLAAPISEVDWQEEDRRWNRLRPLFRPGEMVLVRAGPVPKGRSPYRGPLKVVRVLGRYTFELSDGQKWSARQMKRWIDLSAEVPLEMPGIEQEPPRIAERGPQRKTTRGTAGKPPDRYTP